MANNGNSVDKKIFQSHLWKDKLIPILPTDNEIDIKLKNKMNYLIDKWGYTIKQVGYNNEMYRELNNLPINTNQIRQKNWYFTNLKIK